MIATLRSFDADWLALGRDAGFRFARERGSFVSYDGAGCINIAPDDELDDDDWIGQIVVHELCHHLVMGEASRHAPDWGLENMDERDVYLEHAALRVQAWLADRSGLRAALVATTDFRPWYEALGADPLAADDGDPSLAPALVGVDNLKRWHHFGALEALLARVRDAVAAAASTPHR